jgi:hypothetical protein
MSGLRALVDDEGFRVALGCGLVLAFATVLARRTGLARLGFAVALVGAALGGIDAALGIDGPVGSPRLLAAGLVALAVGATLAARSRWPVAVAMAAVLPGALLVAAAADGPVPDWARGLVLVAIVVAAPLTMTFDRAAPRFTAPLLAVSAAGVYWTVPDTEQALPVLGAFLAVALLAADPAAPPSPGGAAAAVGLLSWTAAVGGYGRPGSIVGAIACLGVPVLVPLVRRHPRLVGTRAALTVGAVQVVTVAVASRVAGLRYSVAAAAAISIVALLAAGLVLSLVVPRRRNRRQAPP